MHLYSYMDVVKLERHIRDGLVMVNHHKSLPLRILTYSRKVVLEDLWDDVTTKCRGLIVGPDQIIAARPFEKFFNVNTTYRPETYVANLPRMLPIGTEKLDGSLGILWTLSSNFNWAFDPMVDKYRGIATKGSFHSDHATWATLHYLDHYKYAEWPENYTPIFEIINEQIQHHIVHYGGPGKLVLTALINNETGEEADYNTCYFWAKRNGMEIVDIFGKTLEEMISEDRSNHEGYVLSYPQPGAPPLKVKIKHANFLTMQHIVHSATPRAILEALENNDQDLIYNWTSTVPGPVTDWIQDWVVRLRSAEDDIARKAYTLYSSLGKTTHSRKEFAENVIKTAPELAPICFAMLDRKSYNRQLWRAVREQFGEELTKPFTTATEADEELE